MLEISNANAVHFSYSLGIKLVIALANLMAEHGDGDDNESLPVESRTVSIPREDRIPSVDPSQGEISGIAFLGSRQEVADILLAGFREREWSAIEVRRGSCIEGRE